MQYEYHGHHDEACQRRSHSRRNYCSHCASQPFSLLISMAHYCIARYTEDWTRTVLDLPHSGGSADSLQTLQSGGWARQGGPTIFSETDKKSRSERKDSSILGGLFATCAMMEGTVCPSSPAGQHEQSCTHHRTWEGGGTSEDQACQCSPDAICYMQT
jgi:hypothetical protein